MNKQLAEKPEAFGRAVGLASKLGTWSSLPVGRKLAARKMADKRAAKVLGPKAHQPEPKKAIQKLEKIAAKHKILREKAAAVKAQRVRNVQVRAEQMRARTKEALAARKKTMMQHNPAQYKVEIAVEKAKKKADAKVQETEEL